MAKRRFFRRAKSRSAPARRSRRSSRRGMGFLSGPIGRFVFGFGYGLGRGKLNSMIRNVSGGALANASDEVVLTGAGFLADRYGSGIIKQIGGKVFEYELQNLGYKMGQQGGLGNLFGGSNAVSSGSANGDPFK